MKRLSGSLTLAAVLLTTVVPLAEGAIIRVRESSDDGSGSIMNDGGADVKSSNGSSDGSTSLMSDLGLTNGNLAADLLALTITGSITDPTSFDPLNPAVSAELWVLRLFGMTDQPCTGCAKLSEASVGSIGLLPDPNNPNTLFDPNNVLFAVNLVGGPFNPAGTTWTAPGGLPSMLPVALGAQLSFQLTQDQVDFIVAQMTGFGVGDVRLGLGATAFGVTAIPGVGDQVQADFAVPEPSSLLLLGSAAVAFAMRRRLSARVR
jgi:hypothetical protein